TPARQCSNKFDIALAYSYFGLRRRYSRSAKSNFGLFLPSLIRIFVKYFVPSGLCAAEALKTTENERTDSALR
ncbi:hypothetical protein, partial [Alistipes communis]|uniref:hypothetical protein n=2 Tax=Alistipes communis TaxID=2585118 RepID=UPI002664EF81